MMGCEMRVRRWVRDGYPTCGAAVDAETNCPRVVDTPGDYCRQHMPKVPRPRE